MRLTPNSTSVLPLPATRDLNAPPPRRQRFKRWLYRLLRRPFVNP